MTTIASFIAGSVGIIMMMLFSPLIVRVAIQFGSAEYFALIVLGLVAASTIADGSIAKGLASIVIGLILGTVGMDMYTGVPRFTFGNFQLIEGISLIAVAMGLYGASEVITSMRAKSTEARINKVTWRQMIPAKEDVRRSYMPTARGTGIGLFCGILPGTGAILASFMAYTVEKRIAKDPSRFGKGAIEGVVAPEASNNAADQAAFIPTMTLGIPGSPTMALMLGVLIIHGITPGPALMVDEPNLFWGLVMSFWIGNVLLVILNIPLISLWVRLLQVPYHLVYPAILLFLCIGVYSIGNSISDVWMVIAFGAVGYGLRLLDVPAAPLILGFVLGPLMEEHFRRALLLSQGDLRTFVTGPISITALSLSGLILLWGIYRAIRGRTLAAQMGLDETVN
jgi:TctA family transporter